MIKKLLQLDFAHTLCYVFGTMTICLTVVFCLGQIRSCKKTPIEQFEEKQYNEKIQAITDSAKLDSYRDRWLQSNGIKRQE